MTARSAPVTNATPLTRAIGVILPSSNRVVERVTRAIMSDLPGLDACFARVPYAGHPPGGYDLDAFRHAAALLAEARPAVILWNATRGALLGFEPDRRLCAAIESTTGIPCTTTSLLAADLLRSRALRRIGLVAQGSEATARRLQENFREEGIEISAFRSIEVADNFAAAEVPTETFEQHARSLAAAGGIDAIMFWSTNFGGYALTGPLSDALSMPVLDSAAIGTLGAVPYALHAEPHSRLA